MRVNAAPCNLKYVYYNWTCCTTNMTVSLQNILKWLTVLPIHNVCSIMGLCSNDINNLLHPLGSPLPPLPDTFLPSAMFFGNTLKPEHAVNTRNTILN